VRASAPWADDGTDYWINTFVEITDEKRIMGQVD
jgi:hypothetical protein